MGHIQDIPRTYTGIAQILSCFLYSGMLKGESTGKLRIWIMPLAVLVQCMFLQLTAHVPVYFWLLCMMISFMMMLLYLYQVCLLDRISLMYMTVRSFLLAEFIASAEWQVYTALTEIMKISPGRQLSIAVMVIVYSFLFFLVYLLEKRLAREEKPPVYTWSDLLVASGTAAVVFTASNLGYLVKRLPIGITQPDLFNTRTLVDLAGVAVMYAFQFRIGQLQERKNLAMLSAGLQSQYDNYRSYQESIELINIKYHDLKHQMMLLRAESDPEKRKEHLDEMEKELSEFKPGNRTGNRVLDVILAGKEVRIKNSAIQFTCVADGSVLEGMHVTDICAIFGNALDNAFEYAAQIEEPEKRIVSMNLSARQGFLCLEISNYCDEPVAMEDGLPVTTKKNKDLHGYGTRSMVYAARKYGGDATFEKKNHFFTVRILIPLPAAVKADSERTI